MPLFRSKPKIIDAVQFKASRNPAEVPRGVHPANVREEAPRPYVITANGERVYVSHGDWIVDEGCGTRFYPITDSKFKESYEPCD